MSTSSISGSLITPENVAAERDCLLNDYRRTNRELNEQLQHFSANNGQLSRQFEEISELLNQSQEENATLRQRLNQRSVVSLQDNKEWIIRAAIMALVLLVTLVLVGLCAFSIVPLWAIAAAMLIGGITMIAFEAYSYFTKEDPPHEGPTFIANPIDRENPRAEAARDSWLESLRRLYV